MNLIVDINIQSKFMRNIWWIPKKSNNHKDPSSSLTPLYSLILYRRCMYCTKCSNTKINPCNSIECCWFLQFCLTKYERALIIGMRLEQWIKLDLNKYPYIINTTMTNLLLVESPGKTVVRFEDYQNHIQTCNNTITDNTMFFIYYEDDTVFFCRGILGFTRSFNSRYKYPK